MRKIIVLILFSINIPFDGIASSKTLVDELHQNAYQLFKTNPDSALRIAEHTESLLNSNANWLEMSESLNIQGWCYILKNEKYLSFDVYVRALKILSGHLDEREGREKFFKIIRYIGNVCEQYEAYEEAIYYYQKALGIAREDESEVVLNNLFSVSYSYFMNGSVDQAEKYCLETLDYVKKSGVDQGKWDWLILGTVNRLSLIEIKKGNFSKARSILQSTLAGNLAFEKDSLLEESGLRLTQIRDNIAFAYLKELNIISAIENFKNSEKFVRSNKLPERYNFYAYIEMFAIYLDQLDIQNAESYSHKALAFYDQVELSPENYKLFSLLSDFYYKTGQYDLAHEMSQRYAEENSKFLAHKEEILRIKNEYQFEELTASFFQMPAENADPLSYWLVWLSGILSLMLFGGMFREYYIRRSLQKSLREIQDAFRV